MNGPEKALGPTGRALGLAAVLFTLLIYIRAVDFPFVNWDDPEYVQFNLAIRRLDPHSVLSLFQHLRMGFWVPLTWLSLALDFWVARFEPWAYHLDNILLHCLNTYLVFTLVQKLLTLRSDALGPRAPWKSSVTAFITSLLFGLHPLHVESVAWVSERKDVLYGLFWLLSLHAYLAYVLVPHSRARNYALSLAFFILSIISKPMAVSLPLTLLLLDHWPLERMGVRKGRSLLEKIPFLAAALGAGLLAIHSQTQAGVLWGWGALSIPQRLMNAGHSIFFYLQKTLAPTGLAAFYPLLPEHLNDGTHWFSAVAVLALTLAAFGVRKKHPLYLSAWLFFLLTLFPALGLLQAGNQAAADRFTYLPSLAPLLLLALGLAQGLAWKFRWVLSLGLIAASLMVMTTLHQISTWKSSVALWENSLTLYPRNNLVVHFDLGRAYELEGRDGDALRKYEDSLSGNADFFYPLWGKGRILVRQGRLAEGVRDYRQAIYLVPQHPALHAELGSALQRQGKEKEALEELRRALRLDPHFGDGYQALGAYYRRKGQWEGAMACFETAWFLDPDNPVYFKDLMGSYLKAGRPQKALKGYQGLAVDPRSPLSLGLSLNAQEGSW